MQNTVLEFDGLKTLLSRMLTNKIFEKEKFTLWLDVICSFFLKAVHMLFFGLKNADTTNNLRHTRILLILNLYIADHGNWNTCFMLQ